jgi:hypothetical protein
MKTTAFRIGLFAAGAASLLMQFGTVAAASLSSSGNVNFFDSGDASISSPCFNFSAVGTLVGCSGGAAVAGTSATLNYLTSAEADYGVLRVSGQSSITNPTPAGTAAAAYSGAVANATFRDQWTITGMPNGTAGTLQLLFSLTGDFDFSQIGAGVTTGFSLVNFTNSTFSSDPPTLVGNVGTINDVGLLTTSFLFGNVVDFQVSLTGGSNIFNLVNGGANGLSSYMDLSNTAMMNAIVVKDAQGNVVPFNLATSSNADLFKDLAPGIPPTGIPEPPLTALLFAAFALAVRSRRLPKP